MSIMQLVKKKKGRKRPGYRGEAAAASDRASGRDAGRSDTGSASGRGDGPGRDDIREQAGVATTQGLATPTTSQISGMIDQGPDRRAVSQFSQFGKNVLAQNLNPNLRFDPRTGGMRQPFLSGLGSTIFGGLLSLINPALGLAFRGVNFMRDKVPETFDKFKSSNTLEEFRDKLRGYGKTMPVISNNPAFGGIESLGVFDDEEEDMITPMSKPDIFNYNNSVGRFDPNANVNTNNITGASQNMVDADQMSNFFNNQQFMDGGIVDLVDIYD